jgi:hypothetical protein
VVSVRNSSRRFPGTPGTRVTSSHSGPLKGTHRYFAKQCDGRARSTAFRAVPLPVNRYRDGARCEPQRSGIDPAVYVLSWEFRLGMAVRNLGDHPRPPHILAVLPQDRERQS